MPKEYGGTVIRAQTNTYETITTIVIIMIIKYHKEEQDIIEKKKDLVLERMIEAWSRANLPLGFAPLNVCYNLARFMTSNISVPSGLAV